MYFNIPLLRSSRGGLTTVYLADDFLLNQHFALLLGLVLYLLLGLVLVIGAH